MAWSGDCAYIAGAGVAVVDVQRPDPPPPRPHAPHRRERGHGRDPPRRRRRRTATSSSRAATASAASTATGPASRRSTCGTCRDCPRPKLLSTIAFPGNVHNLTLTADGKRVWSTLPAAGGRHQRPPPPEGAARGSSRSSRPAAHTSWPTRTRPGRRPTARASTSATRARRTTSSSSSSTPRTGRGDRPASSATSRCPGHSIRPMTIDGKPYLLASDESILNPTAKGCLPDRLTPFGGIARPKIVDLTNEQLPGCGARCALAINEPIHCVDQVAVRGERLDPLPGRRRPGRHDLRHGVDVERGPAHLRRARPGPPARGRLLQPGPRPAAATRSPARRASAPRSACSSPQGLDQAWAHIRYRPDTGHDLADHRVRRLLGARARAAAARRPRPARPGRRCTRRAPPSARRPPAASWRPARAARPAPTARSAPPRILSRPAPARARSSSFTTLPVALTAARRRARCARGTL